MTTYLLDVNVLIALLDPAHVNHDDAHRWFAEFRTHQWVTCPITENAVIRILSTPSYPTVDWLPNEVMDHLEGFLTDKLNHVFWKDDVSLQDDSLFERQMIRGRKQLTDIYLLGLAVKHNGKLTTFDRSIARQAVKGAREKHLELLN